MQSEKVHFTKVQETLLVTLYFKALDSRSKHPLLHDKAAEEALSRIDYDFRKVKLPKGSALGMVIRAKQLDRWTAAFLAEHPDATVLHVGCGLDSRVERIDPPTSVRWYDEITPQQWKTLFASSAGWALDGMDVMLYAFALTAIQREFSLSSAAAGGLASVGRGGEGTVPTTHRPF